MKLDTIGIVSRVAIGALCAVLTIILLNQIALSGILLSAYSNYNIGKDRIVLHVFAIGVNLYLFIYSITGCVGHCLYRERYLFWFFVTSLLNIVLLLVFALVVNIPVFDGSLFTSISDDIAPLLKQSNFSLEAKFNLNKIESMFLCCGDRGPIDYFNNEAMEKGCFKQQNGCSTVLWYFEAFARIQFIVELFVSAIIAMVAFSHYYCANLDDEDEEHASSVQQQQQQQQPGFVRNEPQLSIGSMPMNKALHLKLAKVGQKATEASSQPKPLAADNSLLNQQAA